MACSYGNPLVKMALFALVLTNRSVYIRFIGEVICSNQPIVNEGYVLVSDAASWRDDASLVQVISGAFRFQL
jgi:hypothetical protein